MADDSSRCFRRDSMKTSVGNIAGNRRRMHAVTLRKERREMLFRTKRFCRDLTSGDANTDLGGVMAIDVEQAALDAQTSSAVEELKSSLLYQGKGAMQKKMEALKTLRRLLSASEAPPIGAALHAGAVSILVQCLSFGSPDEQLLEAAWCLTNIAAGELEHTNVLLPALPLLIAHLGDKSSTPVAEQCAWALGNLAGEGDDLRTTLLAQGALPALARMLLSNKSSTVRTAAWALSNLIKGNNAKAATELIRIEGVSDAIIRHLKKGDDELTTEVSWVIVYLTSLSNFASNLLVQKNLVQFLVGRLVESENLQLLIPVLRSLGNVAAADNSDPSISLAVGNSITGDTIMALTKCLRNENRVLKKEAAWVLSNIAVGSITHKQMIFSSEAITLLLEYLTYAPFDIKKEAAYVLGNICVVPSEDIGRQPHVILEHLTLLVDKGCVPGFISLVRSADIEAARLGLQFLELVMRGLPDKKGVKLVEREDGIDAMERFQFHENEDLRCMANGLVDKYFGEDYDLDD